MGIYDDLLAVKGKGSLIDALVPVPVERLKKISENLHMVPTDYIQFLEYVGAGEIGRAAYMLYDGLVEPEEVYGRSSRFEGILLFGDDFQGLNTGFDIKNWRVVEIDPTNMRANTVAPDFQSFIRSRIIALG